jgi:hypothetical protein
MMVRRNRPLIALYKGRCTSWNTRSINVRCDGDETFEVYSLELMHSAISQGDQAAWAEFQQSLEETVLTWLHAHPGRESACLCKSELHFVALAFERLRQAAIQGKVAYKTLSEVFVYLRASLNGVILEALRISACPEAVSQRLSGERYVEGHPKSREVWDLLQARLSSERERRLGYLLYHCGLGPGEIVRCYPQEWSDVHEIARLRRIILADLMNGFDLCGTNVHFSSLGGRV